MVFISPEGLEELRKELEHRKSVMRREIAEKIASAKELGDLSENFEYHEAKDQQTQNETRILELEELCQTATVVSASTGNTSITVGSTFTVLFDGKERTFHLVGSSEADPMAGRISNESPLGQAFLGHRAGEIVEVVVPSGTQTYTVLTIS